MSSTTNSRIECGIFMGSVRFDSNSPCEPQHIVLTAVVRCVRCSGREEPGDAYRPTPAFVAQLSSGAISRLAMASMGLEVDF